MRKDNKKLFKYLGIIFIAVLLTYRLPYKPYSIIEYLIPPIKLGDGSKFYISAIIILIMFIVGVKGLFKLKRFEGKSKVLIFLGVIIIIIPFMNWTLDASRTNYHYFKDDGLRSIEIEESNINLSGSNDETTMYLNLDLKDYGRKGNELKIRVHLPKSLSLYTNKEFYDFEDYYITNGNREITNIQQSIDFKIDNRDTQNQLFNSDWLEEDLEYELYNDKEKVMLKQPGF